MTHAVELYFDFRSPYGYLAFVQLQGLGVELRVKPIKVMLLISEPETQPPMTLHSA